MIRITKELHDWLQANPDPLLTRGLREKTDRVIYGEPGVETDANGDPTGYVLFSHPDLDEDDYYYHEVLAANKAVTGTPATRRVRTLEREKDQADLDAALADGASAAELRALVADKMQEKGTARAVSRPERDDPSPR